MTTCNRCGQPCAYARHDTWKQCAHALKGELTITRRKLEQERKRTETVITGCAANIIDLADMAGMGKDRSRLHER